VTSVVGALTVTVAGTGTAALLVTSARVRDLLYHGQHLTASAVYGRELWASQNVHSYAVTWIFFPIMGNDTVRGEIEQDAAAGCGRLCRRDQRRGRCPPPCQ